MSFLQKNSIEMEKEQLLLKISKDYNIDYSELVDKYMNTQKKVAKVLSSSYYKKKNSSYIIKTVKITHEGIDYLLDEENNIYTFNIDKPEIVGLKLIDGNIKLFNK